MLNIFRRTSQKQYDGPATANVDHSEWNPTPKPRVDNPDDRHYRPRQQRSSNHDGEYDNRHHGRRSSSNNQSSSSGRGRQSESNNNNNNQQQQPPLASGISSRRTSNPQKVRTHLPARVMRSVPEGADGGDRSGRLGGIPTSININANTDIAADNHLAMDNSSPAAAAANTNIPKPKGRRMEQQRLRRPQIPMEHDGGVLCLCAIPAKTESSSSSSSSSEEEVHRFLSGGADGTVKLWEVVETPIEEKKGANANNPNNDNNKSRKGREMNPRLVKTYRGHSGYVHSVAVLGALSDDAANDVIENTAAGNKGRCFNNVVGNVGRNRNNRSREQLNNYNNNKYNNYGDLDESATVDGSVRSRRQDFEDSSRCGSSVHRRDNNNLDESSSVRSYNTTDSPRSSLGGGHQQQHRRRASAKMMPGMPFNKRTSLDSSGSDRMMRRRRALNALKKRLFFVSASRDNTLRLWPIDDDNANGNGNGNGNNDERREGCFDDANFDEAASRSSGGKNRRGEANDPFAKGMKLRGHEFGPNNVGGGVLCVCAVPSLSSDNDDFEYDDDENDDDITKETTTVSAGQFCSGGSDGRIRVWDVRSALNLGLSARSKKNKVPKSGMYATVQLQCIDPGLGGNGSGNNGGSSGRGGQQRPAAITSLICTHRGVQDEVRVALFAGDAGGAIRRYSRMNECSTGHVNGSIWWGCTALFAGHSNPITSMSMLSSPSLLPLLCPNIDVDEEEEDDIGTMLVSSCDNGSVCVWDAFDVRDGLSNRLDASERSEDDDYDLPAHQLPAYQTNRRRIPRRSPMWEIELNNKDEEGNNVTALSNSNTDRSSGSHIGVTSLTTLQVGTLMAAGTTDGAIRMWNVSSGLYEGAYNLGRSVQIWSLGMLSERDVAAEEEDFYDEDDEYIGRQMTIHSAGIIVSGDNRGRIRVMRKMLSRVENVSLIE